MLSMIWLIICVDEIPSISFSGETTILCFKAGIATNFMSSGMTKSRPLIAATALAAFKIEIEALGEAPKNKKGLFLVVWTIEAM